MMNFTIERTVLSEPITVFCKKAESFPAGILSAHQSLHALVPYSLQRKYFGLSRPEGGEIAYYAAAEELNAGEAKKFGCTKIVLEKGTYIYIDIPKYVSDLSAIDKAFKLLLNDPEIDPQGYCIEWYFNETDMRCMIRLK